MIGHLLKELGSIVEDALSREEVWVFLFLAGALGTSITAAMSSVSFSFSSVWQNFLLFLAYTWWFWSFTFLFPVLNQLIIFWRQQIFKDKLEYIVLELHLPREVIKSPQNMEQVLLAFHTLGTSAGGFKDVYVEGVTTTWNSLEIVSIGGQVHFYVRCQKGHRDVIESAFFSYYPDVEVSEIQDYVMGLPTSLEDLNKKEMEMWGTEFILAKEDAYPIKTYVSFESKDEEKNVDPIGTFLESLGKLRPGETLGMQILIAPASKDWGGKWESLVEKLREPQMMDVPAEEGTRKVALSRMPGEVDVLEAVGGNLAKPAFRTIIRCMYVAPKEIFSKDRGRTIGSALNQYTALSLNAFKGNSAAGTRAGGWSWPQSLAAARTQAMRRRMLHNYRMREAPPDTPIGKFLTSYVLNWNFATKDFTLNVEGLATIFHPPTSIVLTAPHVKRVESRKAGPPAGLAIFGEEGELQRFH